MKSRFLVICSVVMVLLLGTSFASAQSNDSCNVITLFNGWAAATPARVPNGVIYGFLVDLSSTPDTLMSASTDMAEAVEFHQTIMTAGDVMQMQPVESGISVAADDYQELKSGGFHMMLVNLKQALVAGDSLSLTLQFQHIGEVKVKVPIVDANETANTMSGMSSMSMPTTATPPAAMPMYPESCAKMQVVGVWARPAGPGMPTSAAYGLLVNLTAGDETLLSVSTTAATTSEIHEMTIDSGDVMQMRPVEGGLVIPAGGAVVLQPGGKHIMLTDLTQVLVSGMTMDLTLTFAHSGELKLTIPIHDPPSNPMSMDSTLQANGG